MTINEVIAHYGTQSAVARAVGVTPQSVQHWVNDDEIPEGRQWQIQALTNGALVATQKRADETSAA